MGVSEYIFVGFAILVFIHAIYYRYQWRSPHRLYHMGVSKKGHAAYLRLVEFEIVASLLGIATTLLADGFFVNVAEAIGVLILALLFAFATMAEVWSRGKLKKRTFFKRLIAPTVLGVFVSLPSIIRFGRRLGDIVFAQ